MYPQPQYREMGKGAIPSRGKIQKITLEWQTEQLGSVDSVVARVKGKHHDGDVISWAALYAVKSGGTASSFVLCGGKGFSFWHKKAEKPHHHSKDTKEKSVQKIQKKNCTKEKAVCKETPESEKNNDYIFKEEFTCTTKSPIT